MTRSLSGNAATHFAADNVPLLVLAELQFDSGTVRLASAAYDIPWNGYTWLGAGRVVSIDPLEEGASLEARGLTARLSGVPSSFISLALGERVQGRTAKVWVLTLDSNYREDGYAGPWIYRMDYTRLQGVTDAQILLQMESRLAAWENPRVRHYNNADQQAEYPDDKFFEYVEEMTEKPLITGVRAT